MNRVKNKHENHWQSRPLSHETDVLTFIKLPDNSYGLPPGVTSQLVKDGGLFRVDERFDRTIAFNGDDKVDWSPMPTATASPRRPYWVWRWGCEFVCLCPQDSTGFRGQYIYH
jgi:hypothetical protein